MENYHVIELVGEGSFGKVYKARRKKSAQIVAIKFIVKHGKTETIDTIRDAQAMRQESWSVSEPLTRRARANVL